MTEITQLTPRLWITWEIMFPVGVFLTGPGAGCAQQANHSQKSDSLSTTESVASAAKQRAYGESHTNDRTH